MTIIPRISEALDTELIRQRRDPSCKAIMDLDAEHLAITAMGAIAERMDDAGFRAAARWLAFESKGKRG